MMSFSFRDKPRSRLSDRIRGKSGDELLQELRQEFDKDRTSSFFDSNPNWGFTPAGSTFPRRHMFDDDDDVLRSHGRGRTDLRAHLDDLARRHPEFADHLRSPPGWVSDFHSSGGGGGGGGSSSGHYAASYGGSGPEADFGNKGERRTSNINNPSQQPHQQTQSHPQPPTEQQQQNPTPENIQESKVTSNYSSGLPPKVRDSLLQHGLRNTDPEIGIKGQAAVKEDRNQRSMSAPPDGRSQLNSDKPQRFVSKIEINPVNPATGETATSSNSDNSSGKPPMAPPKQQPQQQPHQGTPPQHKQSTIRHIPIFVEGRDEPVLPKNVDQEAKNVPKNVPPSKPSHQFTGPHPQPQFHPNQQQQFHPQQQQNQQQPQRKPSQHQNQQPTNSQQSQPETKENVQQQNNQQPSQPQAEKKQKFNNDPMYQIQLVQSEVDELRKSIDQFKGSSRTDKDYIYLDEMLTRNLIKLDIIETDGKENVRAARKETIRSIQQCINLLESKVPQTPITQTPSTTAVNESSDSKMDVDEGNSKNGTVAKGDKQDNSTVVADNKNLMETDQQMSEQNDKSVNSNQMIIEDNQQKASTDIKQNNDTTNQSAAVNVSDSKDNNTNTNEIKC